MALTFQKGQNVTLKTPAVPNGPVIGFKMDGDGNVAYLVEWTDASGDVQQRWFTEAELVAA
jgi:uncharacterized protein YodC (DUF2158 family)